MATFVYQGTEERTFDVGIGLAPTTVRTGDRVSIAGPAMLHHLTPDLVPDDADTRRQIELLREKVAIADARQFAPGTPPKGGI